VRDFVEVRIASRNRAHAEELAGELGADVSARSKGPYAAPTSSAPARTPASPLCAAGGWWEAST
jgi:ornithine cyclodeaminase/alanine dehydrogenase-like protein (mu-crystallin family)